MSDSSRPESLGAGRVPIAREGHGSSWTCWESLDPIDPELPS